METPGHASTTGPEDGGPSLPPPLVHRAGVAPRGRSPGASALVKVAVVGVLVALLQVPVVLIRGTLSEREARRDEAVADIASTWGGAQTITGPLLAVPYAYPARVQRETMTDGRIVKTDEIREMRGTAWFLPAVLEVEAQLEPSERYRGIFRTPVYAGDVSVRGHFEPDPAALGLDGAVYDWAHARIVVVMSDPRGLRSTPTYESGESALQFAPAARREGWSPTIEAAVALDTPASARSPFTVRIEMQGASRFAVSAVGASNRVTFRSSWRDPSFDGRHLPVERTVAEDGFDARWETTYFGRSHPQQWVEQPGRAGTRGADLEESSLGVTLATPVDAYRLVERSLKYALLFIVLVFAVFFLFEVTAGASVHPVQYLMVGGALMLFYLGFLALGEFVAVGAAYGAAAAASTALITGYSWAVLKTGGRTAVVGAGVAATYGCLYVILQMQDYALLGGTLVLFVLLAAAMWFTRRLDWFRLGEGGARAPA